MTRADAVCCMCLPASVYGALLGAIHVLPITVLHTLANTLISLALLPHDIVLTYYTLAKTPRLGPNIKALSLLLLPIPLALWPVLVLVVTLIGSILHGFFFPFADGLVAMATLDNGALCRGSRKVWSSTFKAIKDFYWFNTHSYFDYLCELRSQSWTGERFDINFVEIVVGLGIALVGVVVATPLFAVVGVVKLAPGIVRAWIELSRAFFKLNGGWGLFFFVWYLAAFAITPAIGVLIVAGAVLTGAFRGVFSAVILYDKGIVPALKQPLHDSYGFDKITSEIIFGRASDCVMLGCFSGFDSSRAPSRRRPATVSHASAERNDRHEDRPAPDPVPTPISPRERIMGTIPLDDVWEGFFAQSKVLGVQAVDTGALKAQVFAEADPAVMVGLPAVVLFRNVLRSIQTYPGNAGAFVMSNGIVLDEKTRPKNPVSNMIYYPLREARKEVEALNLAPEECAWVQAHLLTGGEPGFQAIPDQERKTQVLRAVSKVVSVATTITRLPAFRRRFAEVIDTVADTPQGVRTHPEQMWLTFHTTQPDKDLRSPHPDATTPLRPALRPASPETMV